MTYRPLPGGLVEFRIYCTARGHLDRVGQPSVVGVTRGNMPTAAELDDFNATERPVCPACQLAWMGLPEMLRPAHPADA